MCNIVGCQLGCKGASLVLPAAGELAQASGATIFAVDYRRHRPGPTQAPLRPTSKPTSGGQLSLHNPSSVPMTRPERPRLAAISAISAVPRARRSMRSYPASTANMSAPSPTPSLLLSSKESPTQSMFVSLTKRRRPPEHPCPAAIEDVCRTYRHLLAEGSLSANATVLAGNSAAMARAGPGNGAPGQWAQAHRAHGPTGPMV